MTKLNGHWSLIWSSWSQVVVHTGSSSVRKACTTGGHQVNSAQTILQDNRLLPARLLCPW
eukprot:495986-Rhodomonas_salina.1